MIKIKEMLFFYSYNAFVSNNGMKFTMKKNELKALKII